MFARGAGAGGLCDRLAGRGEREFCPLKRALGLLDPARRRTRDLFPALGRGELALPRGLHPRQPLGRHSAVDLGTRERGPRLFGLAASELATMLGLSGRRGRPIGRLSGPGGVLGLDHLKRRAQPG